MRALLSVAVYALLGLAALAPASPAQAVEQLFIKLTPDPTRLYNGWNGTSPPGSSFVYRTFGVEIFPGYSVETLKVLVQNETGFMPDVYALSFGGRVLGDFETLEGAGIPKEAVLDVLLPTGVLSAVPEPGVWSLMILGFGLLGGRMRARHASAAGAGREDRHAA